MKQLFACASLLLGSFLLNATEITLSGTWELSALVTEDDVPYTTTLIFEPSSTSSEFGGALYQVTGNLDGIPVQSASIETINGEQHIVWWLVREDGIDLESNLILSSTPDTISLGGDFERYEVATMRKISQ